MNEPRVHDLVRVDPALARAWDAPAWVGPALARAPWAVVRRARAVGDIPIGIRGATRAERFAAHIALGDVREHLAPSQLVARISDPNNGHSGESAAKGDRESALPPLLRVARAVDAAARELRLRWGPVGAYGFELASGVRATHAGSDLDIVIFVRGIDGDPAPTRPALAEFARRCSTIEVTHGVRIDADVIVEGAGIALAEFASNATVVLAKTPDGPRLIAPPR